MTTGQIGFLIALLAYLSVIAIVIAFALTHRPPASDDESDFDVNSALKNLKKWRK